MRNLRRMLMCLLLIGLICPVAILAQPKPEKHTIKIKDMKFDPDTLEIKVGESVTWTNSDEQDHTVTESNKAFNSDNLKTGKSFTFKFDKAGKFSYACTYHPRMKGTVTVVADDKAKDGK